MKSLSNPKRSSRRRIVIIGVITVFVALASFYAAMYLLTPYSGFARALIWMDADIKDYERFPARTVNNAPPVFNFQTVDTPTQNEYLRVLDRVASSQTLSQSTISATSFNELLTSTQTTAFFDYKRQPIDL